MITNPCSESWDHMAPNGNGRYCESCEKNIVDLSSKTDKELIEFFKKKNDKVCGRLHPHQLNREMFVPQQKPVWPWLLPLAIGVLAVSPTEAREFKPALAQGNAVPSPQKYTAPAPSLALDTISGKVIDERTGLALAGVKVRQKGYQNVLAITDSEGNFKIAKGHEGVKVLAFEQAGYRYVEVAAISNMQVKLMSDTRLILGRVSAVEYSSEPLYLLYAGKKSCVIDSARLKTIDPDWIQDFELLDKVKAAAVYGSKAANGAIVVHIKKEFAKQIDFSKKEK